MTTTTAPAPALFAAPLHITDATLAAVRASGYDSNVGWQNTDLVRLCPEVGAVRMPADDTDHAENYLVYRYDDYTGTAGANVAANDHGTFDSFGPFTDEETLQQEHATLGDALSWVARALEDTANGNRTEYLAPGPMPGGMDVFTEPLTPGHSIPAARVREEGDVPDHLVMAVLYYCALDMALTRGFEPDPTSHPLGSLDDLASTVSIALEMGGPDSEPAWLRFVADAAVDHLNDTGATLTGHAVILSAAGLTIARTTDDVVTDEAFNRLMVAGAYDHDDWTEDSTTRVGNWVEAVRIASDETPHYLLVLPAHDYRADTGGRVTYDAGNVVWVSHRPRGGGDIHDTLQGALSYLVVELEKTLAYVPRRAVRN